MPRNRSNCETVAKTQGVVEVKSKPAFFAILRPHRLELRRIEDQKMQSVELIISVNRSRVKEEISEAGQRNGIK